MVYGYGGVSRRVCRNFRNNGSLSALEEVDEVQSDRVSGEHSWEVVAGAAMCKSAEDLPLSRALFSLHFTFRWLS